MDNLITIQKILDDSNSLIEAFLNISAKDLPNPLCGVFTAGSWGNVSRGEFLRQVQIVSYHLQGIGVKKGSTVAIISNTRFEWLVADFAIHSLGAISVSVYQSLIPSEVAFILIDSNVNYVFVENQEQTKKIEEIVSRSWKVPAIEDRPAFEASLNIHEIISFENSRSSSLKITQLSDLLKNQKQNNNDITNESVARNDIASIVYTSGTTGPPKGVMQTHGNHLSNIRQVLGSGLMLESGCIFLFLPLAHSFARLMAYLAIYSPLTLKFPEITDKSSSRTDTHALSRDLVSSNPEIIPVVPRLLEKIKSKVENLSSHTTLSSLILRATITIARKRRENPSILLNFFHFLTSPVRKKIKSRIFGKNYRFCISGGAKLPLSIQAFFNSLDILVLQGYGLTETCVATNACRASNNKDGSVGPTLSSDIEIKILEDEEIAIRGPNVSIGYLNRPKATKESWTKDNWYLTGDQGRLDQDGFLFITGRKKEIIVTSGGKKIVPTFIEELVLEHKIFSQCVVVGEGRKFCSVIISFNLENLEKELPGFKIDLTNPSPEINSLANKCVEKVNSQLASYESLKKIIISPYEFTAENGLLTPSMKIKRKEVELRFKDALDIAYGSSDQE